MPQQTWTQRRLEGLQDNALWAILTGLAGVGLVYWKATSLDLPPGYTVITGLLVFVLVVAAWNQVRTAIERHRFARYQRAVPAVVEMNLARWMTAFGMGSRKVNAEAGEDFRYIVDQQAGGTAFVYKPIDAHWVVCEASITVPLATRLALGPSNEILHRDMELEFGRRLNTQYTLDWHATNGSFTFTIKSYTRFHLQADALDFMEAMDAVNRTIRAGRAVIERTQHYARLMVPLAQANASAVPPVTAQPAAGGTVAGPSGTPNP